jgi:hypothetical protein
LFFERNMTNEIVQAVKSDDVDEISRYLFDVSGAAALQAIDANEKSADAESLIPVAGNSPNMTDGTSKRTTLLHWAAYLGYLEMVRLLLSHPDADKEPREADGKTPLHWAAFEGHEEVAVALVAAGASLSAADSLHHTPAHLAIMHNHAGMAERVFTNYAAAIATPQPMAVHHRSAPRRHTPRRLHSIDDVTPIANAAHVSAETSATPAAAGVDVEGNETQFELEEAQRANQRQLEETRREMASDDISAEGSKVGEDSPEPAPVAIDEDVDEEPRRASQSEEVSPAAEREQLLTSRTYVDDTVSARIAEARQRVEADAAADGTLEDDEVADGSRPRSALDAMLHDDRAAELEAEERAMLREERRLDRAERRLARQEVRRVQRGEWLEQIMRLAALRHDVPKGDVVRIMSDAAKTYYAAQDHSISAPSSEYDASQQPRDAPPQPQEQLEYYEGEPQPMGDAAIPRNGSGLPEPQRRHNEVPVFQMRWAGQRPPSQAASSRATSARSGRRADERPPWDYEVDDYSQGYGTQASTVRSQSSGTGVRVPSTRFPPEIEPRAMLHLPRTRSTKPKWRPPATSRIERTEITANKISKHVQR